jgi:MoaA/NifB/PqqE/SkfB family radical SAM enzyme
MPDLSPEPRRITPADILPRYRTSFERVKQENSRLLHEDIRNRAVAYRALPEVIAINHTNICNLECIMCPRNRKKGRHRLPRRVLEYVTDELFPTARKAVLTTSGGEPLAVDFDLLLEKAIQYEVKLDVITNGILLTPELYRRASAALDHLNISCDCHVPGVYEYIRKGAKFERLHGNLMGIRDLRRENPDGVLYSLSAVVLRCNLPHLSDFVRFACEAGADGVVFQRVRGYLNPAPEELPENAFTPEEVLQRLEEAGVAAREAGINLYLSEFNLQNVVVNPVRQKIPEPIEDQGLCWLTAQNFSIMYTGEVYPCCVANDHCYGNVLYQDLMDIWNSRTARALRAAHLSGRGTLFCSGCLNAPHLDARRANWIVKPVQRVRMIHRHVQNILKRRFAASHTFPIFDPPIPECKIRDGEYRVQEVSIRSEPFPHMHETLVRNPWDLSLWFIYEGSLFRTEGTNGTAEHLVTLKDIPAPMATGLYLLSPRTALLGFLADGKLLHLTLGDVSADVREVLALSDSRSFIRGGVARSPDGTVWVGEYGVYPGARCANLYRSDDGGGRFEKAWRFEQAKHIHALFVSTSNGKVIVTTGDLAGERRLYLGSRKGPPFKTLQRAWSGFTAVVETERFIHFGTDLKQGNGFLRYSRDFNGPPEFRPFPGGLDIQIRQIVALASRRILALGSLDRDLVQGDGGRRASLFLSHDEGTTWTVLQPFAEDWSDVPEKVEVLQEDPLTLLTIYSPRPAVLRITGISGA